MEELKTQLENAIVALGQEIQKLSLDGQDTRFRSGILRGYYEVLNTIKELENGGREEASEVSEVSADSSPAVEPEQPK